MGGELDKRRKLIIALGVGTVTTSLASFAQQQGKVWRVGVLVLQNRAAGRNPQFSGAFTRGMRDLGYVEGKTLVIEWRLADSKLERLPGLATNQVRTGNQHENRQDARH